MAIKAPSNLFNRRFSTNHSSEMILTGFFYAFFKVPTEAFGPFGDPEGIVDVTPDTANKILTGACVGFTPADDVTMNEATFDAMNGIGFGVPSNISQTRTFSATFNEFSGSIVNKVLGRWFANIRDPLTGVSKASTYTVKSWAGDVYYVVCKPNGKEIEYCAHYTEVRPQTLNRSSYASTLNTADKIQLQQTFNFNMVYDNITNFPGKDPFQLESECRTLIDSVVLRDKMVEEIHKFPNL